MRLSDCRGRDQTAVPHEIVTVVEMYDSSIRPCAVLCGAQGVLFMYLCPRSVFMVVRVFVCYSFVQHVLTNLQHTVAFRTLWTPVNTIPTF